MKIKWNGHASFTITGEDGTVIVTDPYEPGCFGGAIAYGAVDDRADVVLVSHDHADHNYTKSIKGSPQILKTCQKGMKINNPSLPPNLDMKGIQVAHDEKDGAERGKNCLWSFTVDGVRVAFMGDLGHLLSDDQLKALGKVDLLLTPIGGVFTLDPKGASKLIDQINPRLVIPMHFKTEKCGFPLAEVDDFAKLMIRVKKTGESEVSLDAKSLPAAGPEVWVLEYAR